MVFENHSNDFWSGDFAPDESSHPSGDEYPYNSFLAPPTAHAQAGPTFSGTLNHEHQSDLPGVYSPPFLLDSDYGVQFGVPLPPQPASPAPLEFDEIVDLLALLPNEAAPTPGPDAPAPDQLGSGQTMGPSPMQIPTSYPGHANHVPYGAPLMSASVPDSLFGSQVPMSPDAHRARSSSYAGSTQTQYHHSISPSAFLAPPNLLGFNGRFQIEFQEPARDPSAMMSPLGGPTQHILQFNSNDLESLNASPSSTIQPSSIPLPASPSEESSSASSPTLSPATSTSSLAYPPSPSASRTETFKWRLNSHEDQGWRCECESKAKKRKRHLESCPSNPNKPTIKCPHCSTIFKGGSRKSALSKHMGNFHGHKPSGKKKDKRR